MRWLWRRLWLDKGGEGYLYVVHDDSLFVTAGPRGRTRLDGLNKEKTATNLLNEAHLVGWLVGWFSHQRPQQENEWKGFEWIVRVDDDFYHSSSRKIKILRVSHLIPRVRWYYDNNTKGRRRVLIFCSSKKTERHHRCCWEDPSTDRRLLSEQWSSSSSAGQTCGGDENVFSPFFGTVYISKSANQKIAGHFFLSLTKNGLTKMFFSPFFGTDYISKLANQKIAGHLFSLSNMLIYFIIYVISIGGSWGPRVYVFMLSPEGQTPAYRTTTRGRNIRRGNYFFLG